MYGTCVIILLCAWPKLMTKVILFHENFFENLVGYNVFL